MGDFAAAVNDQYAKDSRTRRYLAALALLASLLLLSACGNSHPPGNQAGGSQAAGAAKVFRICPGPDAQRQALIAFFDAREGDTIEFCAGRFDFTTGLIMTGKRGITVRGAGMHKTILSFADSRAQDGLNINQSDGFTIEDLTIYDAAGNGLRIFRSQHISMRRTKIGWSNADPASPNYDPSREPWAQNGPYAYYAALARHILIEDSVTVGSSDAGFYIGQSSDILLQRVEAFHNVGGVEFENTYRAEIVDSEAHDNVGGILVFDLPVRVQFGEKNRVHRNRIYNNNLPQFAARGAIVALVPQGTGMLLVATDQLEIYDNEIADNRTVGIGIVNYGLADSSEPATNYDFYPEGVHIYNNRFRNNGALPALPDYERSGCLGDPNVPIAGLPGLQENPLCLADNGSIFPLVLLVKNQGKAAHIVWDGGLDRPNDCDQIPVDRDGIALTLPNPNDSGRREPRTDERGRPNFDQFDPAPVCKWNAWKFKADGSLKLPQNGMCIEANTFENPVNPLVDDFANAHFTTADPFDPANLVPAEHDKPGDCPTVKPELLPLFVPAPPAFTPHPDADPRPTTAEIAAACNAGQTGQINRTALLKYNCPQLDQYRLFMNPEDPRTGPAAPGVPFDLNTALFSDYASKYRFLFLPPGADGRPLKAKFQDSQNCDTLNVFDCYSATLAFPVGTVLAKTFSFKDGENENVVETRLLIKRQGRDGEPFWVGLPYLWSTAAGGQRVANLVIEGSTAAVNWSYDDPDPEVAEPQGARRHYSGATDRYAIPDAGACFLCHNGDDLEPGAPPIGPKVRNLNRNFDYPGLGEMNQLAYLQTQGLLDLPDAPENLERLPKWNVPGSSGAQPGSPADLHHRARAFLEVNCYHCHNPAGNAQNSGLVLDSFTNPMTQRNGICKPPIAAGKAADFGNYDIVPGNASQSILPLRVATTEPGAAMPPLSRSVVQNEVVELLIGWVDTVVADFADPDANVCGSTGSLLPIPGLPIATPDGRPVTTPTAAQEKPFG
ncbi:MAG: parallel beta-helix domain-containing protein [Nevskiales bacterium]